MIITYIKSAKYHSESSHTEIKYNFVSDIVVKKIITIIYISIHNMVADPLTKVMSKDVFVTHARSLSLRRL